MRYKSQRKAARNSKSFIRLQPVGQRKALAIAVKNSQAQRRWSKLNQWLCGEPEVTARSPSGPVLSA
jgi:hypothetical protein